MDTKICLDTDMCIEILKDTEKGIDLLNSVDNSEVFITAVSVFELFLRETNLHAIEKLLLKTSILDFSELCARKASEISKEQKRIGRLIEIRDLFIASTAIINNCTLATLNKKHFENIKELELLNI